MYFEKNDEFENIETSYICNFSKAYIARNQHILSHLDLNKLTQFIVEKTVYGTPIFKLGNKGKKIMIISGIHGNELPPQIASMKLINKLYTEKLNNTIYFIPFASPKSTMNNERTFNGMDLNRSAHIKNSISNLILKSAIDLKVSFIGDFHSTSYNSNPGIESVFASKSPTPESFKIASYISHNVGSKIIAYEFAGTSYKGALEDVSNLNGIPAITCEVLSPFASIGVNSVEKSIAQIESFLNYFKT